MKSLNNTTSADILHIGTGRNFPTGGSLALDPTLFQDVAIADAQTFSLIGLGSLVLNNGTLNITDPAQAWSTLTNTLSNVAIQSQPPLASNAAPGGKSFFQRTVGVQETLILGVNTFIWTQSLFPMSQIYGIEVIGGEAGDFVDFNVLDSAAGLITGVANYKLNQFGFTVNIAPGYYAREALFPAQVPMGLQFQFVYNSKSAKSIGINLMLNEVK